MKKFFAAILTVFLSLGLLTACGGGQQHGASSAPVVQSVERSDTGSADKSKSRIRQNHKPPVKRVVCRRAISPYHYDQRLKALAFTLFKPLCPSYSATP